MWWRLKQVVLKAAFADGSDKKAANTAAWSAAERIAERLAPETEGEMGLEAAFTAATEVYYAIKRYQVLRVGLPDPPKPVCHTPRRPIRVRAKAALVRLINRFRMATRVLVLGHRPATVRFDELDRMIARRCADLAVKALTGQSVPQQPAAKVDVDTHGKIAQLAYEAIEGYVTYSVESERDSQDLLACHEAYRLIEAADRAKIRS